jgi:hypothetical protein
MLDLQPPRTKTLETTPIGFWFGDGRLIFCVEIGGVACFVQICLVERVVAFDDGVAVVSVDLRLVVLVDD